jgi:tripartite-type tricarboxylate transporter receptor subunit TctC
MDSKSFHRVTALLHLAFAAVGFVVPAHAADWTPTQPIKLIVPFTAGGGGDQVARVISDKLSAGLGQPVVIDNRGGAGGVIGAEAGARSAPDGYTLVLGSDSNFTINPNLSPLRYDPIKDFEPVSLLVNMPMVLVVNPQKLSAGTIQELLVLARTSPGKLSIASSGNGSSHHIAAELLKHAGRVDLLHVPYKGQAAALADLIGGQVDAAFAIPAGVLPYLKTGKLKALAVSVSRRVPELPDVPTLAEAGLAGYDVGIWIGLLYPARTPKAIVDRMNNEVSKVMDLPDVRATFASLGYSVQSGQPEVLAKRLQQDTAIYRKLINEAKLKAN